MKIKFVFGTVATLGMVAISTPSFAQTPISPVNEARARVACGSGTLVSATRLPNGAVRVTCSQNTPGEGASEASSASQSGGRAAGVIGGGGGGVLAGTGLGAGPVIGAVAAAGVLAALAGSSDSTTTSPSSTGASIGEGGGFIEE